MAEFTQTQHNQHRLRQLIALLADEGVIHTEEGELFLDREDPREMHTVNSESAESPSVTRAKVDDETHRKFAKAYADGDQQEQFTLIWEVLTGVDVSDATPGGD